MMVAIVRDAPADCAGEGWAGNVRATRFPGVVTATGVAYGRPSRRTGRPSQYWEATLTAGGWFFRIQRGWDTHGPDSVRSYSDAWGILARVLMAYRAERGIA